MFHVSFSRFDRWQSAARFLGMTVFQFIPFAVDAYLAHQGRLYPLFPMVWHREPFPVILDGAETEISGKTWGPLAIGREAPGGQFLLVHRASGRVILRSPRRKRCLQVAKSLAPVRARLADPDLDAILAHPNVERALSPYAELRGLWS